MPWLVGVALCAIGVVIIVWLIRKWQSTDIDRFELVSLDIQLGGFGKAQFRPNVQDIQVAHRIWTELVTRKAALPIEPEHDVIVEVYDSWYVLFGKVRDLIGDIPAQLIRKEKSTELLVKIAVDTLNNGLRPHLTRWQAHFRNWYKQELEKASLKSPQEIQKGFPEYAVLIEDMQKVNRQLIQYAKELRKVVLGK